MSPVPLISIVTPSLNRAHMIEQAIQSVLEQKDPNIEHIIMDGGSTDNTVEILSRYPHLKVIQQRDKNLYDAINQGLQIAKGEFVGLLNSDDVYEPGCFSLVREAFQERTLDSICGAADLYEYNANGRKVFLSKYGSDEDKSLNFQNVMWGMPIINARFFRRSVFERVGFFDITYPIAADREWLLRCALKGITVKKVNSLFYHYQQHSQSLTFHNRRGLKPELNPDYVSIIWQYSADSNPDLKKACRDWHTWMTGYALKESIRQGYLYHAYQMLKRGMSYDSLFFPRYLGQWLSFRVKQRQRVLPT